MPRLNDSLTRRPRHVALAFPTSEAHLHGAMRAIVEYARSRGESGGGWVLTTGVEAPTLPIQRLSGWKGDGVIATLVTEEESRLAQRIARSGVPVVTFSGALRKPGVPRVRVDNANVGRLAAEHLVSCGFRRFGFYGPDEMMYSHDRARAFTHYVTTAGFTCKMLQSPPVGVSHRVWRDELKRLGEWLASLEGPVGIYAANDYRARMVIDACERRGLRVPADVGVIGTDDNAVVCDFSAPTITSVACDWYKVGMEAAKLLEQLMNGKTPPATDMLVPPIGLHRRESTNVTVVEDARVARAIEYVRDHLGEVFGVERMITASGVSRRSLEAVFLSEVGVSPYRYLCQQRVERAKELLVQGKEMKMSDISTRCGFLDARRFRLVFRRLTGKSPASFLRERKAT